jgi:RNA polymerase-interacting CarD/CdnL/TRCF family regulator
MQFKVGDQVVHTSHGNGHIVAIVEKQLNGKDARSYYQVVTSNSTVWVPVDSDSPSNLRLLVSNIALMHCRDLLKSRPMPLHADRRQRDLERTRQLQRASFEILCEAVRDLAALGWPKPLSEGDASALRKIQDAVCQEWAVAAGITFLDASREVMTLLQVGRQTHHT